MEFNIRVVRIFQTDYDYAKQLSMLDGLICIGKYSKEDIRRFQDISEQLMIIDMVSPHIDFNSIVLDFRRAVFDVMDYLTSLGHKKIAYLGGVEHVGNDIYFEQRKAAFIDYCISHDLEYEPYIIEDEFSAESGYQMMQTLLKGDCVPTAVFAASDPIAIGALRALHQADYHIPDDISVVGFDDINVASYTNPPLTTVHAPAEYMGKYAARFIHHSILQEESNTIPLQITLPCTLIKRDSCGKAPK